MKKRFLCLGLILALAAGQVMPVSAARKDDVKAEKANTENKLSQAESREAELEEKKSALLGEIDTLDQELVQVLAQIDLLDDEIVDKTEDIEETKENLTVAEANRDEQYDAMQLRIQYLYENGGSEAWIQMILEADSIADLLSKAEYIGKMYQFDREELKNLKETVQEVTDLGNQLEEERGELEEMKLAQEDQQENLEVALEKKKATATDYESQIADLQAQASEYRSLIDAQNSELRKIQEDEIRAAEQREEENRRQQEAAQNNNSNNNNGGGNSTPAPQPRPENNGGGSSNNNGGESSTPAPQPEPESNGGGGGGYSATGEAVVAYASQFIGNPYVYGGNSLTNGIDCSGFTQQVFAHFGYSLPRVSDAQAGAGRGISYSEHRAGDIIVYSGHVAILTGDGGIIHASNSKPYPQGGIKYSGNALYRPYIAVRRIVE